MLADRVLFLDGEALVIDKPAGLPVDRPRDGSLSLENHLESLRFGFQRWPTAVHRLDHQYTTFGKLIKGQDVLEKIGEIEVTSSGMVAVSLDAKKLKLAPPVRKDEDLAAVNGSLKKE